MIVQGKHLVIGNVGDSRAILGTKDEKGAYVAVQLTVDLKPNLPSKSGSWPKIPLLGRKPFVIFILFARFGVFLRNPVPYQQHPVA